jgi:glyoxylase-like metal-dependent hydrolase (beta-lactamase superfamily II)
MRAQEPATVEVVPGVARFRDTCNVYVLHAGGGGEAVLIDFGTGAVLDELAALGIDRVSDVLVTHHHRDQVQGLQRAVDAGARIWVPPVERDLVADVDRHWLVRPLDNDYELLQDRFSLLQSVPVTGTVDEYRTRRYGAFDVYTLPTPGHTVGSVTYLIELDGRRLAFSGDLIYGEGKVWSLAATQWTYTEIEGQRSTYLSLGDLARRDPAVLLPSHGDPIEDPGTAIKLTQRRLDELMAMRALEPWDLEMRLDNPWGELTPHLLRNRTSMANSFVLRSESGAALVIDFGYDLWTGHPITSADLSARRPLLGSIEALKRDHGVDRIEVVVPTHYHDDHVAGINLLRDVEGTAVWTPENFADVLEDPHRYDLPCLWFDPIRVDRRLPLRQPIQWHEYELTVYPLPGHTLYAAAIAFEVDGQRVLATGDQQTNDDARPILNYQYRNRFAYDDFVRSAELYKTLRPDLIISGHWPAREVDDAWLDELLAQGRRVAELHRELLPVEEVDFGAEGFGARIEPYSSTTRPGGTVTLDVTVRNPFDRPEVAIVRLVVPAGWAAEPDAEEVELEEHGQAVVRFDVVVGDAPATRARVAADLTVGEAPFGQQAEALVTVE